MTSCELPRIHLRSPGDLIETVPYLIGFHPTESLVLVGFQGVGCEASQRVTVAMRVDLPVAQPTDDRPHEGGWRERPQLSCPAIDELVGGISGGLQNSGTQSVIALAVTDLVAGDPRSMPALVGLKEQLMDELSALGLAVLDVLVTTHDRWWSLCCNNWQCCPEQGTARVVGHSTAAAQATYAGLVALPDRNALAETLTGLPTEVRATALPAVRAAQERFAKAMSGEAPARFRRVELSALLRVARAHSSRKRQMSGGQLARLGAALTDIEIRDTLWLAIDSNSLEAESLLRELHGRLPAPYDAPALFLYGWSQWRKGNGTLATMAAERALRSDRGYSAAALLISAVQSGLDPRSTPALSGTRRRPG